jgi:hypothetical protein
MKKTEETQATEQTGNNAQFDFDSFKTSILDEVNKSINGFAKKMEKDIAKLTKPTKAESEENAEETKTNPAIPVEVNTELQKRDRKLKEVTDLVATLTAERDQAQQARLESERQSAVKDAMAGIQWRDQTHQNAFYKMVIGDVIRDEDGTLVAKTDKGNITVSEFIQQQAETVPGFLAAQGRGGSGASQGGVIKPSKTVHIEDIKPGMTPEQKAAAWQQAAAQIQPQ